MHESMPLNTSRLLDISRCQPKSYQTDLVIHDVLLSSIQDILACRLLYRKLSLAFRWKLCDLKSSFVSSFEPSKVSNPVQGNVFWRLQDAYKAPPCGSARRLRSATQKLKNWFVWKKYSCLFTDHSLQNRAKYALQHKTQLSIFDTFFNKDPLNDAPAKIKTASTICGTYAWHAPTRAMQN